SIPASLIGHQANLAQTAEDGTMEWYPISMLFFNLCLILSIGFCVALVYFGYQEAKAATLPVLSEILEQVITQNQLLSDLDETEIERLKTSTFDFMPFWISGIWLMIHAINIYLAGFVSRASNLMPRPRDDIPASLALPVAAVGVLAIAIVVGWATSSELQYYTGPFLGIFLTGFSLVGLAMLHERARSSGTHLILLLLSYALIFLVYLPLFVFAGAGILRSFKRSKNTPASPGSSNT
ncbi:MAG: hypothetical protein AAF412_08625, partial [Pseudomonadota bacterium]